MFKKLLALLLAVLMVVSMAACANDPAVGTKPNTNNSRSITKPITFSSEILFKRTPFHRFFAGSHKKTDLSVPKNG